MTEKRVDLVFEGGGVKAVALIGALSVLEERGFEPQHIAGTSGGAVVAVLLAAGFTAGEMRERLLEFDFGSLRDVGWEDRIPLVSTPLSILKDQGIYEGEALQGYVRELLEEKGVRTFGDLEHPIHANRSRYHCRVQVIVSDITGRRLLVLPQDADRLGIENPGELEVALAVRMSTSIPFFFEPVHFENQRSRREHLIVDGGILSNFPVWLFDVEGEPEWPTFGLRLVEPEPRSPLAGGAEEDQPQGLNAVIDYAKSLIETMLEAHDRLYLEQADFARTICIPTLGVSAMDFDLSRERKVELYESGRAAAEQFLEIWSFEDYVAEFRRGRRHSRRAEVARQMHRPTGDTGGAP